MNTAILTCTRCGWRTTAGEDELAKRLRTLGLLRRAPHPPPDLVGELLRANAHRITCNACGKEGLAIVEADDGDPLGTADTRDDWQQAIICEVCREPISPERLEVFPDVRRCAKCQTLADRGVDPAQPEYCPRCGALLEIRVSTAGGITRYKQFCTSNPPCRL